MRIAIAALGVLTACLALPAAADAVRIGLAAPLTGTSDRLGHQMLDGASVANGHTGLEIADDGCTAAGGAAAARQFVGAKVSMVVGFLCAESIEAALPILKDAHIPVITPGVRVDSLTDRRARTGFPIYRLGPRDDAEAAAVASLMTRLWSDKLVAIIDDGTIYGRDLAETFRAALEAAALKPIFIDTFRPQMDNQIGLIGRLRKAGATHVFVGGDRDDIAIMGRDAAGLNAGIVFAGGESLRSAPGDLPLAAGTLMVGLPEWADLADKTAIAALEKRGIFAEGYVLPAYAAVQVALEAAVKPAGPEAFTATFATAIGPIRFDDRGDLADNPYRLFSFDGTNFVLAPTQ